MLKEKTKKKSSSGSGGWSAFAKGHTTQTETKKENHFGTCPFMHVTPLFCTCVSCVSTMPVFLPEKGKKKKKKNLKQTNK